jgi:hypothetical protein
MANRNGSRDQQRSERRRRKVRADDDRQRVQAKPPRYDEAQQRLDAVHR